MAEPIDILMTVNITSGSSLKTEVRTEFASVASDGLGIGFTAGAVFALKEFEFSVGVGSSISPKKDKDAKGGTVVASDKAKEEGPSNPDIHEVEFTRIFDAASIQLLAALVQCTTLHSLSVIKRKAAGTANAGEPYLRLDFSEVLLTSLDWRESNSIVEETGRFIYRKLMVRYRVQTADGSLGSTSSVSWTMPQLPTTA